MSKVLILCAHRPKRSPSQRYRFEQYLPYLQENGFNFTWSYLLNEKDDLIFYSKGNFIQKLFILLKTIFIRLKDIKSFKNFDIIFIQREAHFFGTSYFEKKAFKSGAKVIFDFDDSIWLADTSPGNKKFEFVKQPQKFFKNIQYAHIVLAGNDYLKNKALNNNKNTIVIPTTIDTNFHKPILNNESDKIVIGWSGSISTIKHFEDLVPVLEQLQNKYKHIEIKVIGQNNYINSRIKINSVAWSEETEVQELNTIDVGIMPIPDDEWANGKCGLKGLAYMACGIATVMSNVGVNKHIITHKKNGLLCTTQTDWFTALEELILNKSLRIELGMQGRKSVEEKFSVNANKEKYLHVFNEVLNGK